MGTVYGDGPIYKVDVCKGKKCWRYLPFEGYGAFSKANACYDEHKLDPETLELSLLRLDGGEWKFVEKPIQRNANGDWEQAKSA
jgi:hypothetical protein